MKNKIIPFIFIVILLAGCEKNVTLVNEKKVVCILFDLSETTNKPEIRNKYLEKFKMVLNKMQSGDAVEAALITEKSLAELDLSINFEFPSIKPFTDTDLAVSLSKSLSDSLLKLNRDSLILVADSILLKPTRKIPDTEILASLQIAERVFRSFSQPRKILVVFSDMIEDSRYYNFNTENLTDTRINNIIRTEKENNRLPDLKDVKVYVAGATHKDIKKFGRIKDFWFEYFNSCNAKLAVENYGAALIKFDE
jgi:hypothetical protein